MRLAADFRRKTMRATRFNAGGGGGTPPRFLRLRLTTGETEVPLSPRLDPRLEEPVFSIPVVTIVQHVIQGRDFVVEVPHRLVRTHPTLRMLCVCVCVSE